MEYKGLIEGLEKGEAKHQEQAKKIRDAIDALQALCPHQKSTWLGNDHSHNYYRCTNCKIILEK
jgi:FPC/CPF motif-containing protein YcgG